MTTQATLAETIEIADLDQFVRVLVGWHSQKTAVLKHIIDIPVGSEMTFNDTGPPVIMAGDFLDGFKAGIDLALIELGVLPFVYEQEADTTPPTPDAKLS
jgi:hypothetical protein